MYRRILPVVCTTVLLLVLATGAGAGNGAPTTSETFCSIYQMVLVRSSGKSWFSNVSQQLLYVYYCNTSTGKIVRTPLFSSPLLQFYWSYTNTGLKLAQLRFYEVATQVA